MNRHRHYDNGEMTILTNRKYLRLIVHRKHMLIVTGYKKNKCVSCHLTNALN